MAIQFARVEIVSRSKGGSTCCKGAYNARSVIKDERNGVIYNFHALGDNVYHVILLPDHVDQKFKNVSVLMNAVEESEKQKNSQLLKDVVIALPDDKELNLEDRINITHRIIDEMAWIKNGLGVQVDIHQPHDGEKNWHAHLLVMTRRFTDCGKYLSPKKARDLNPVFKNGANGKGFIIPEEDIIHEKAKRIINDYFKDLGIEKRVDMISTIPQEHIGPVRMRNILNKALMRNEIRQIAHLENMRNGHNVLDRITRVQSVFSIWDIERAVRDVPDEELKERLMEEALSSERLVPLYRRAQMAQGIEGNESKGNECGIGNGQNGLGMQGKELIDAGLFTTKGVREEEKRIMRMASTINGFDNSMANASMLLRVKNMEDLSQVQREALEAILCTTGGIRILRGRAGSGKSYVLGAAHRLAKNQGHNVIGLAPTNKARVELQTQGFEQAFTLKGFLFALKNGRTSLPTGSLIVLDEAGMMANADLQELLKVVGVFKANLVLAGDERQLHSVERGGLFEVVADRFGSYELAEIRRQKEDWGREMASCFAKGYMIAGLEILQNNGGIKVADSLEDSISDLISQWQASKFDISQRLIVTVANKDVDALNDGIREILKQNVLLKGEEIAIEREEKIGNSLALVKRTFMAEDRVVFAANNKEIGVQNGEFGTILEVSKDRFMIKMDHREKEISFDPVIIDGLRHGYAVTTYKSQGASIRDVYNLHAGIGSSTHAYVNLTRHIESLKLFYNRQNTRNLGHLAAQLSRVEEKVSSLKFVTKEDFEQELKDQAREKTLIGRVGKWVKNKAINIGDRLHTNAEYYKFEALPTGLAKVEEVLEERYEIAYESAGVVVKEEKAFMPNEEEMVVYNQQLEGEHIKQVAMVAGGGSASSSNEFVRSRLMPKESFYQRVENTSSQHKEVRDYKAELDNLKEAMKYNFTGLVLDLLGEQNKKLSNSDTYRYGSKGSLAVSVRGSKAGTWYDFEVGEGGDIFGLVQRERNQDFKEAAQYLKDIMGISRQTTLRLVHDNDIDSFYKTKLEQQYKESEKSKTEAQKIHEFYGKVKNIGEKSVAHRYLKKARCITTVIEDDIKTTGIWDKGTARRYPAIIAFARDKDLVITGGQSILLDPETGRKADVSAPKKSFGQISGSFVEVQRLKKEVEKGETREVSIIENKTDKITFIAEGVETALSIKEAGFNGKILCSLGIGNIKNYLPEDGERILICADNDGVGAKTLAVIEKAKTFLEEAGAIVYVIRPKEKGDFNDVLKNNGVAEVKELIEPAIEQLYQERSLGERERVNSAKEFINNLGNKHAELLQELQHWGGKIDYNELLNSLVGIEDSKKLEYIKERRNTAMEKAIKTDLKNFAFEKKEASSLLELKLVVEKEQKFLGELFNRTLEGAGDYSFEINKILYTAKKAVNYPQKLELVFKEAEKSVDEGIQQEFKLVSKLGGMISPEQMLDGLKQEKELYVRRLILPRMGEARVNAKTLEEVLKAVGQEQEFLAGLHGNLKHCSFDKELLNKVRQAHENQKDGIMTSLQEVVEKHLNNGISKDGDLVRDLQRADNIKGTYHKLDREVEAHEVKKKLLSLNQGLAKAATTPEALKAIDQRQEYLADCHSSLKYQDHQPELMQLIKQACEYEQAKDKKNAHSSQDSLKQEFYDVVNHVIKYTVMPQEQLLKALKASTWNSNMQNGILQNSTNIKSIKEDLTKNCQNHYTGLVEKNVAQIIKNQATRQAVEINGRKFDCEVKYIEHEIAHPAHLYVDQKSLKQLQHQVLQVQRQKQMKLEYEIGGPSL